ncbi:MAG: DUF4476 domain-containing protein [Hymenobacteraceae bacterium]|nr:DUF4476 domain-containing protein [Hymenobacteraceae bacterium]
MPVFLSSVRLFLVLALLLNGLAAVAADLVRARIYSRGGERFSLLIDGHVAGPAGNDVQLPALPAGYHWLEFRFPNRRLPARVTGYRIQAWFAPGFESVYELDPFPARARMTFTRVACTALVAYPDARQFRWYDPNVDPGYDPAYGPGGYQSQPETQTYAPGTGYAPPCAGLLQPSDVNALISSIQAKDFEATKVSVAKQAVGNATILAEDVARVLRTFDYESTRLDFAKFAYARCCDQRNYFKVNDAFEFESSTTDLQRFTQSGR